jgi:hypothetical protein
MVTHGSACLAFGRNGSQNPLSDTARHFAELRNPCLGVMHGHVSMDRLDDPPCPQGLAAAWHHDAMMFRAPLNRSVNAQALHRMNMIRACFHATCCLRMLLLLPMLSRSVNSIYNYTTHENSRCIERMRKTQSNAAERHSPLTTSRHIKRRTTNKKHRQTTYYFLYYKECNTDLRNAGTSIYKVVCGHMKPHMKNGTHSFEQGLLHCHNKARSCPCTTLC